MGVVDGREVCSCTMEFVVHPVYLFPGGGGVGVDSGGGSGSGSIVS